MPDGILPAPPTGGAFWWCLDFVEIIGVFGDLVGVLLAILLQSRYARQLPQEGAFWEQQKAGAL